MPDDASLLPFSDDTRTGRALLGGALALGAALTGAWWRRRRRARRPTPEQLPPAVDGVPGAIDCIEGVMRYVHRPGTGTPIVLLHSINAVGSSCETAPIYTYLARRTDRPLYALDWLGFGRSDRPAVRYTAAMYERHLRRFLSEKVHDAADVVALSLGGAYAAQVALEAPILVRRLALVMPTALSSAPGPPAWLEAFAAATGKVGAFALFYERLTQPDGLRRFYAERIFADAAVVPDALVGYGAETARVQGADRAPQRFLAGKLQHDERTRHVYARLAVPTTCWIAPHPEGLVQDFDLADEVAAANPTHLTVHPVPGGLLPHWARPDDFLPRLASALDAQPAGTAHATPHASGAAS